MKKWAAAATAAHPHSLCNRRPYGKRSIRGENRALSTALIGRKLRGGTQPAHKPQAKDEAMTAKTPSNHGKSWKPADVKQLKQLASGNTPTRVIGLKMGRTPAAIYGAAGAAGVSLKPTNQRPYNRKKP
jgi:hypothetical protein